MIPKINLCCLPTPCHPLPHLSKDLGIDLWIKRDDLTGFAGGGNKGRKLEYIIAKALESEVDTIVSCGSRQSNFIRQLGAACSMYGLRCCVVAMDMPYDKEYGKPTGMSPGSGGNEFLDELFGVEMQVVPDDDWLVLFEHASNLVKKLGAEGRNVLEVPVGGSMPLGAYAFTQAAIEVGEGWDFIVTATSSGSTHAGLAWAFHGSKTRVIGISCDPEEDLADDLKRLTDGIDSLTNNHRNLNRTDFDFRRDWVGPGYNVESALGQAAIKKAARQEGLLLDPIYSGKAFSGLLDLASRRELSGRVLFWHTGGLPTLLAVRS